MATATVPAATEQVITLTGSTEHVMDCFCTTHARARDAGATHAATYTLTCVHDGAQGGVVYPARRVGDASVQRQQVRALLALVS